MGYKSDTLAAKISDIQAALSTHDSSPIIAPINSNSQQSQRLVFNAVNILDKEKLSTTTTIRGNESDQSNRPPHPAIWKPPPWPILKVNFDGAIFQEQNFVGMGVVIRDDKCQVVASMDEKITLPYSITTTDVIVAMRALKLALAISLSPIVLKEDSKNTIDALRCEGSLLVEYSHLVDDAKRLAN